MSSLMKEMLSARPGIEFLSAKTGAAALARMKERQPDLALLDLVLANERGETVLGQLRQAGYKGLASAVSANALAEDRARALRDGFDAFWAKPVDVYKALTELDMRLGGPALPAGDDGAPGARERSLSA